MRTSIQSRPVKKKRTYEKADPNQTVTGLLGRFVRPAVLGGAAAVALVAGFLDDGPQLTRLGFAAMIVAVLWATSVGFALGTLRLAAGLATVVVAFALISVGGNARNASDLADYRSLRSELEIELNLLRGTSLTNGEVLEGLSAAEASALRARTVCSDLTGAVEWAETSSLSPDLQLNRATRALTDRMGHVFAAVGSGRVALGLEDRQPPDPAMLCEPPDDADPPLGNDQADSIVLQAPAPAAARVFEGDAQAGADAVNALVETSEEVFGHLEVVGFVRPSAIDRSSEPEDLAGNGESQEGAPIGQVSGLDDEATSQEIAAAASLLESIDVPEEAVAEATSSERACVDQVAVSAEFAQTLVQADRCVVGCAPGAIGGTCTPQAAKRLLLFGFQAQLETLTADATVTETQQELASRLAEIRAAITALDEPVAIHSLALDGADVILGDAVQKFVLDDGRAARLGGWGWVLLVVASIIGYRLLEMANDRRSPGPVAVRAGESTKETESKTLAATELVKAHLTKANLQEPSPLPGGEAVSSVSSSPETASFENAVVRYIANLFQTTAFPSRGVDLVVTTQPAESGLTPRSGTDGTDAAPGGGNKGQLIVPGAANSPLLGNEPYRIMVKANRKSRSGLVFSHPFTGDCLEEVTHSAAYFAAERLLDAGWTTPSWLVWSSQDGSALRSYQEVMIEKESPRGDALEGSLPRRTSRRRLERAVRSSPGTGAALVALSHEAALEGDFVASAHYLLLASNRHPRFLTARYRLGVTLSMLASDLDTFWSWDDAKELLLPASNERAAELTWKGHRAGVVDLLEPPASAGSRRVLFEVTKNVLLTRAIEELSYVVDAVSRPKILMRACRQAERKYWLGLLRSPRRRLGLRAAAESARALAKRRLASLEYVSTQHLARELERCDRENETAVQRSRDDWLVRYNAACYEAACIPELAAEKRWDEVMERRTEALDHLRRARYARNGQQLSIEWAMVDPDLVPLRGTFADDDDWFGHLASAFQVEPDEYRALRAQLRQTPRTRPRPPSNGERAHPETAHGPQVSVAVEVRT